MKEVTNKIPFNYVMLSNCNPDKVHVAMTSGLKYILIRNSKGYIFISSDGDGCGHSGYFDNFLDCIQFAIGIKGTKIFEFDSFKEAAAFIVK